MSTFVKVGTADLRVGTMDLYGPRHQLCPGQDVAGKVEITLTHKVFVRGIWVKFSALITSMRMHSDAHDVVEGEKIIKDLLKGEDDYFQGGVHDVLVGFGEEEGPDENGFVEMEQGTYSWPYYFKIPMFGPLSYCDNLSEVIYSLQAVLDTPMLSRAISQVQAYHIIAIVTSHN